jgi:hypothetical protein
MWVIAVSCVGKKIAQSYRLSKAQAKIQFLKGRYVGKDQQAVLPVNLFALRRASSTRFVRLLFSRITRKLLCLYSLCLATLWYRAWHVRTVFKKTAKI